MSDLPIGGDSPLPTGNLTQNKPTADQLLGPAPRKPTPDDILGLGPEQAPQFGESFFQPGESGASGGGVMEGPIWDAYASQGPVARILSAFGQGAKEGWGAASGPVIAPDTEEMLRKSGMWADYQKGHSTFMKSLNEAFMRSLASGVYLGTGAVQAGIRGAQGAIAETGAQLGVPQLGRDVAALPEALIPEAPHFAAEARVGSLPREAPPEPILPPAIEEARAYNVIGPGGEAAWKGTNIITGPEEEFSALHDRVHAAQEAAAEQTPGAVTQPAPTPTAAAPADVRTVARQMQPDLFNEYDALDARREMLRRQLDDVSQHPAVAALEEQIDTLRGQRLQAPQSERAEMANRITNLEAQRQAWVEQIDNEAARQQTRLDLLDTTHRMWDLAPQIRNADRAAAERGAPITDAAITGVPNEPVTAPEAASAESPASAAVVPQEPQAAVTPTVEPSPTGFTTSKGSTYEVHEDGTTTRNKSFHPEHGAEDVGLKARSAKTIYVNSAADSINLSGAGLSGVGPDGFRLVVKDGKASLVWRNPNGQWGTSPSSRDIAFTTEPGIGKYPVEMWKPETDVPGFAEAYSNQHAGNQIVSVDKAAPAEAPMTAPAPAVPRGGIAGDVARQLVTAGRPAEEAEAVGAIQDARYRARAANLVGATPEQLYADEAPVFTAGRASGRKRGAIDLGNGQATVRMLATSDASTAIHELGHSYLEEMIRDSADERATDAVKADADTVQKWLGVDEGESPTTRQHEKFARSFERYMMEGRAPTPALASVFAKFQQWLTDIYQTVKSLRAPISDDIRKVFDRMLTGPERPTIEAREEPLGFADRHEALAERTPPERATQEADLIRAEADKIAAEKAPEIHAELAGATRPAERVGAEPSTGERLDRNANAAEPTTGHDATPGATGTVSAGGSQVATESRPVRPANEFPNNPTAPLPRGDTELVDKAGNIRLDNIETPEDFKEALRQAAERNDDFLERRRGVVSDQQRMALANVLGIDPSKVFGKAIGEAFSDSEVKLIEKTLAQSTGLLRDAALKAQSGKPEDILAFTERLAHNDMIQGLYSQATAEGGRTFRALQKSKEFWSAETLATNELTKQLVNEATGRTMFQMQKIAARIAQLDQAGQINKFARDALRPGVLDWIQSWFINALLSGPFTHAGYTAAGQIFGLFRGIGETSASALVGALRSVSPWSTEDRALIGEMPHQLYGQFRGARSGVSAAWEGWKANRTVLPPEVEALNPSTGQAIGTVPGTIPNPTVGGVKIPVGSVIESPSRMVAALHSFNWTTFYSQSISGQAFRQAMAEKLEGQAFSARVAYLTQTPTEAMIKEASDEANSGALVTRPAYDSFMGKLSRVTNMGYKVPDIPLPGGNSVPMGTLRPVKYIDPFVQIQANVLKTGFGRGTPLALFSQDVRDNLMMKNGGVAFDRQAGKLLAGTGFMIAAGGLAAEGILNWSGPDRSEDQGNKARAWARVYGMPHGLKIGELSFDMLRLGNLGLQMSVAADLYHVAAQAGSGDVSKAASELVMAFAHNILDESFARGPAELMRAVDESDRYGAQWMRNFAKSFVPFSVGLGQLAREIDPYSRQARTTTDAIIAGLPLASETLFPIYDVWGQPVSNRGWAGTYYQHLKDDPVDSKLYELGIYPSLPKREIVGVALTDQQYADFTRMAGRMAHLRVSQIVSAPGFNAMPTVMQMSMINHAIETQREAARTKIKMDPANRGILNAANAAIRAKLHGEKPPPGGWPQTVH